MMGYALEQKVRLCHTGPPRLLVVVSYSICTCVLHTHGIADLGYRYSNDIHTRMTSKIYGFGSRQLECLLMPAQFVNTSPGAVRMVVLSLGL